MSSFKKQEQYIPEKCDCCNQTLTYLIPIDKGTVEILKAIARAILNKGINAIHPRKEMEVSNTQNRDLMIKDGFLTSNMVGNLSRPRFHGLIAKVRWQPGNYCLTTKGAKFLKGSLVPRYAIRDKVTKRQIGYWLPEKYQVSIKDFSNDEEYWEGIGFDIVSGHVIVDIIKDPKTQKQLPILKGFNEN